MLYEVSNRGNKSMLTHFNRAAPSFDPRSSEDFGDGLLMNQGYTLLWVGWQFDMPDAPHLVYLYPPVAEGIQGIVRAELTLDRHEASYSVADRNHKPYKVLNPDDPNLRLTVRDQVEGPRTTIPRADWHIENGATIVPKNGFDPGRIYEWFTLPESSGRRHGFRSRARCDFLAALRQLRRGCACSQRPFEARLRVRSFAERPLPPDDAVFRVQSR